MKYLLIIGDGMADDPIESLGGKSPLEYLDLPAMNRLAGGSLGLAKTVPDGVTPGSDTAILNIFGYDPRVYYTGRSVLEAAGVGVLLKEGEVSFRINLCALEPQGESLIIRSHNGGGIEGDEAQGLMEYLVENPAFREVAESAGLTIAISRTFRHIGVLRGPVPEDASFNLSEPHSILDRNIAPYMPKGYMANTIAKLMTLSYDLLRDHPINRERQAKGLLPANMIWPWGPGRAVSLPSFVEKYGHEGKVVSAVPLVWGIAALAGLEAPKVEGATGDLDTNYQGKIEAVMKALETSDFAAVHVEAPDEMAHAGDLPKKLEALRRLDSLVIEPLLHQLPKFGDFRILFLCDHWTLLSTRGHDGRPVPFALHDSRIPSQSRKYSEKSALQGMYLEDGGKLMDLLFEGGEGDAI